MTRCSRWTPSSASARRWSRATVSGDGRVWQFRLRESLRFHDNEPVRAADCVASIRRWDARDTMGQTLMGVVDQIRATSDRGFEIRLKRPFPLMLDALGKLSTQALFVVPERVGLSDPLVPNTETIGSGPFRFLRNEWVPGSHAVFECGCSGGAGCRGRAAPLPP
jgi:peptide/nickel transport system substrate-binding protein